LCVSYVRAAQALRDIPIRAPRQIEVEVENDDNNSSNNPDIDRRNNENNSTITITPLIRDKNNINNNWYHGLGWRILVGI
jgi:hypothetical protein